VFSRRHFSPSRWSRLFLLCFVVFSLSFFFNINSYDAVLSNTQQSTMKHNRQGKVANCRLSYSLLQKIAAIDLARAVGKKPAARRLGYHLSMIRKWCHAEENLCALINVRGVIPTDR
jgi:hypothetical protein